MIACNKNLFLTPHMGNKITCPKCRAEIPLDDVNVARDIALCRQCGQTWSYGDLMADLQSDYPIPQTPPAGTWFHEQGPRAFTVGVTTRSLGALFIVPFTCVWAGGSMTGIYGTQIYRRHFELGQSLFGIPFLLGSIVLVSLAAMTICGKMTVSVDGDDGVIFTGVGPIGWRRRFNWRKVTSIRRTQQMNRNGMSEQITFDGEKRLNFAGGIKAERLDYLLAVLRKKWRESGH
jgi:hypothetical protein